MVPPEMLGLERIRLFTLLKWSCGGGGARSLLECEGMGGEGLLLGVGYMMTCGTGYWLLAVAFKSSYPLS